MWARYALAHLTRLGVDVHDAYFAVASEDLDAILTIAFFSVQHAAAGRSLHDVDGLLQCDALLCYPMGRESMRLVRILIPAGAAGMRGYYRAAGECKGERQVHPFPAYDVHPADDRP